MEKIGRDLVRKEEVFIEKVEEKEKDYIDLNKEFILEELERAVYGIKVTTAPGKDGIDYKMIKELPNRFKEVLLKIINVCWQYEIIPNS